MRMARVRICLDSTTESFAHVCDQIWIANAAPKGTVVARELALDLADATYALDFAQHVAGITNGIADRLSRKHQPGKLYTVPEFLCDACEMVAQPRSLNWWRTKKSAPKIG